MNEVIQYCSLQMLMNEKKEIELADIIKGIERAIA